MTDITERLDRLQAEVSQLREMALMQTAILQCIAIKMGVAPDQISALSPTPIPSPLDIQAMLRAKDQAAGL